MNIPEVVWTVVPPPPGAPTDLPYPTHSGTVEILGHVLKCHMLNTGERIYEADAGLAGLLAELGVELPL